MANELLELEAAIRKDADSFAIITRYDRNNRVIGAIVIPCDKVSGQSELKPRIKIDVAHELLGVMVNKS
jgi:hypothetical protein